jgi:hypothetical protein
MVVNANQIQVISIGSGRRVPETPLFPNLAAFHAWWAGVTIQQHPPQHAGDTETIYLIHAPTNHIIRRFRTAAAAQMWGNTLRPIQLHHGPDIQHNVPNFGVIHYPKNIP